MVGLRTREFKQDYDFEGQIETGDDRKQLKTGAP